MKGCDSALVAFLEINMVMMVSHKNSESGSLI